MEQLGFSGFSYAQDQYLRAIPFDEPERYRSMLEALRLRFQLPLERIWAVTPENDASYFRYRTDTACIRGSGWTCRVQNHVFAAD